jgi:hypothetical protein
MTSARTLPALAPHGSVMDVWFTSGEACSRIEAGLS